METATGCVIYAWATTNPWRPKTLFQSFICENRSCRSLVISLNIFQDRSDCNSLTPNFSPANFAICVTFWNAMSLTESGLPSLTEILQLWIIRLEHISDGWLLAFAHCSRLWRQADCLYLVTARCGNCLLDLLGRSMGLRGSINSFPMKLAYPSQSAHSSGTGSCESVCQLLHPYKYCRWSLYSPYLYSFRKPGGSWNTRYPSYGFARFSLVHGLHKLILSVR